MPPVPTADSGTNRSFTKAPGAEPLPGYKLIAPLGRGGFGEVWKCEAPGGLHKAIKFVTSDAEDGRGAERFGQELAAFEQIKAIRHPFLLTLERVEQIEGELIMVMELADRQLQDRFRECRTCGLPGIPRDELLAYFGDAAEALDVISAKHNLQHLDIKPANLFLVSGHVKVGDYGLVAQLGADGGNRGLTPRYVAPEVLHGTPSSCSDQYSLALVYQELLTGEFPYTGRTPQQLMLQHVSGKPNLAPLPPCDQPVVEMALAKKPEGRFPSCLAFVQALMSVETGTSLPSASMNVRRARVDRSVAEMNIGGQSGVYQGEEQADGREHTTHPSQMRRPEQTQNFTIPGKPHLTVPGRGPATLPPLVSGTNRGAAQLRAPGPSRGPAPSRYNQPMAVTPPPSIAETPAPLADEHVDAGLIVLERIFSVLPVASLIGMSSGEECLDPYAFANAVVSAAAGAGQVPHQPGEVGRLADGMWVCQFPSTVPASVVPLKLAILRDTWGVTVEQPDLAHLLLRRVCGGGGMFSGKKFGYELSVRLPPPGKSVGEITALGRTFGNPDQKCAREAPDLIPRLLEDVRSALANAQDRRRHPRVTTGLQITLYPVHSDGSVDACASARCRDVSLGGLGFVATAPVPTKYAYVAFTGVSATAGQAILVRIMHTRTLGTERHYGAQYRTDL